MSAENIEIGLVDDVGELNQILDLQRRNLVFTNDGFVTVRHSVDALQAFHESMPSVVARHEGKVVGYALAMPRLASRWVPVLEPMFHRLQSIALLSDQRWYVMGQVCIDQSWRGRGLFDRLYAGHRRHYADRFDWLVTEIAMRNPRSRKAHARVGFVEIDHYQDDSDEWSVVGWKFA